MARKRKGNPVHGWVNFDKPYGMTSTQAVSKVRWLYQAQKAGHAGTLDPLATGILPIALGEATKTVPFLVEAHKGYICEIAWGEARDTLDAEGDITATSDVRPDAAQIEAALPEFIGDISQTPPRFSAIKIDGQRAYDLARAGEHIKMKPRGVRIDAISVIEAKTDSAIIDVRCGKGTYIRSLARDLALALGTVGYVKSLRRTHVGPFTLGTALALDCLEEMVHKPPAEWHLLGLETALDDIPAHAITDDEQFDIRQGRAITLIPPIAKALKQAARPRFIGDLDASRYVLAIYDGKPVALCDARAGQLSPKRVFMM
ncbi:MAG: tRNA pseudouridine(55) synthase TruB [Robiginitomaculum sp.]